MKEETNAKKINQQDEKLVSVCHATRYMVSYELESWIYRTEKQVFHFPAHSAPFKIQPELNLMRTLCIQIHEIMGRLIGNWQHEDR